MTLESIAKKLPGGIQSIEHRITCPLDHFNKDNTATIQVFIREVVASKHSDNTSLPLLVYLQGGPGFPSPRPGAPPSGWLKKALEEYRVLLLDQRGTGLSTPITAQSCAHMTDDDQLAEYLSLFRADSIVHDLELFREKKFPNQKLTLLGQSFGGFCILSYISFFPQSLERLLFTVGLAPVTATIEQVYTATYARMTERNRRYYQRYPQDKAIVGEIVHFLTKNPTPLPSGGILTARRFATLGANLGFAGGMESLHYLLESAWFIHGQQLATNFLISIDSMQSGFDTNPIYYFLHESIYCNGNEHSPSQWAAERIHAQTKVNGEPLFDWDRFSNIENVQEIAESAPLYFSGEMVFSWMADDYVGLRHFKGAAMKLAAKSDWQLLYNMDNLRDITIPTAALVSYDDVFVDRELALATASILGDNCSCYITNEYQHSGLRDDPSVFEKLLKASKGEIILPS
ncbi:hypothetical protein THRCLA_11818 [Thraustotheca clavata]|uniref:AB hydrolase-1 domain-containing protein n=1 Tax=Thraustotheca clavata TaxID=74557 RepID=A0A1V9Y6I6_9STRA|nr:hypothetical protein THRCLA_11818 [Thraustotheca clavata]